MEPAQASQPIPEQTPPQEVSATQEATPTPEVTNAPDPTTEMPASPITPPPEPKQSSKLIFIILAFLLVIAAGGAAYFFGLKNLLNPPAPSPTPIPSPITVPSPSILPSPSLSATSSATSSAKPKTSPVASQGTLKLTNSCQNESIKLSIKYPSTWTCTSNTPVPANGTLTLKSSLFELIISNLGRDATCQPGPTCTKSSFYTNDLMSLDLYSVSDVPREIYGRLTETDSGTSVAIKYTNIATTDLTSTQKAELTTILDSLTTIK